MLHFIFLFKFGLTKLGPNTWAFGNLTRTTIRVRVYQLYITSLHTPATIIIFFSFIH
ncbi:hypothetical protein HanXRQr2_Chr12g0546901 [Helianthus annuus]|uniref:Uncharacterized protein n=1 Tax=Helianthus annuus TaxID=4232 RepID=A0A9K3HHM7_HELAN|nr:hypothetical protein HanXRQr2_Chr12g0546901 [Helianthus annuus]KAJ0863135.1 hypothetical protein HanPSC8_Chr12g0526401 [Helianthus annuus]